MELTQGRAARTPGIPQRLAVSCPRACSAEPPNRHAGSRLLWTTARSWCALRGRRSPGIEVGDPVGESGQGPTANAAPPWTWFRQVGGAGQGPHCGGIPRTRHRPSAAPPGKPTTPGPGPTSPRDRVSRQGKRLGVSVAPSFTVYPLTWWANSPWWATTPILCHGRPGLTGGP